MGIVNDEGIQIGRYKVRHSMQQANLKSAWKRKIIHTTDRKHSMPIAANILARQFNPNLTRTFSLLSDYKPMGVDLRENSPR